MSNTQYETRIVAWIDILGFKDIVSKSELDSSKMQALIKTMEYLKAID